MPFYGLNNSLPIYVTRKTANGDVASYSISIWMSLLVIFLGWTNAVVWGALGLYFAVKAVV